MTPRPLAVPLKELALAGILPPHQAMDQPTLAWIAENLPAEAARTAAVADLPPLLMPQATWFTSGRQASGIHGVRHNARVCVLAGLLARLYRLKGQDSAALRLAAAVHDCRRRDDRADPGHGRRAAAWLGRHHPAVTAAFGLRLPVGLLTAAGTAVSLHDIPYPDFTPAQRDAYQRAKQLTDLLKAADCMDRYRLPVPRWWPDTSRLRVAVPTWLHGVAADLMLHSEQARLHGASHHEALTHACHIVSLQP